MKRCIECQTPFDAEDWRCPSCGFEPGQAGKWQTFAKDMIDTGPKEFGDDTYARMSAIEENSFYCHSRLRLLQWAFRRFFPEAANFYDFGAGTGYVLQGMRSIKPGLELYGSDLSVASLAWVDSLLGGDVRLFHADAERIPYQEQFDVIGAFDVLEHIDDDTHVLTRLHQAVKPGGGMLC